MPTMGTSGSAPGASGADGEVRVFMSYRRTDDANFNGRFHDKLIGIFGETNVFRDIDSIPAGTRFEDVITDHLAGVDAVLAMIGPTWSARVDTPRDFVRMEIAHALQSGTPVIPVLIEDTELPTRESLPDDLKPLLDRQTVRVRRDPDFHRDAARVVDGIREAVRVLRQREAELQRVQDEAARRQREAAELEQSRTARRRELEAELAAADARVAEERRAAEALETERTLRLAELARLEEEMTQRRIADERQRVAEIVESQAQREAAAEAAEGRAAELRDQLADLPAQVVAEPSPPSDPDIVTAVDRPDATDATDATDAVEVAELDVDTTEPVGATVLTDAAADDPKPAPMAPGLSRVRRGWSSASPAERAGGVLLLVATAWAIVSMFTRDADGANAFSFGWPYGAVAVLLTAGLLLPFAAFVLGISPAPVAAGTSIGYMAFQGLADAPWFWDEFDKTSFPTSTVLHSIIFVGAWLALRLGRRPIPSRIDHRSSRWLLLGATAAGAIAMLMFCDRVSVVLSYDPRILWVYTLTSIVVFGLSLRRGLESTIVVAIMSAECVIAFLAYVIHWPEVRGRAWNVVIAAALAAATALWRCRRAVVIPSTD